MPKADSLRTFVNKVPSGYGDYNFFGLFAPPGQGNLLNGPTATSPRMTLDYCASFCSGTVYFAVTHGKKVIPIYPVIFG